MSAAIRMAIIYIALLIVVSMTLGKVLEPLGEAIARSTDPFSRVIVGIVHGLADAVERVGETAHRLIERIQR